MIAYVALLIAIVAMVAAMTKESMYIVKESSPSPISPTTVVQRVFVDKNAGSVPETYDQVGYLSGPGNLIPLYGKKSEARRGRWFYYAIVKDTKVPVYVEGRDCMREVACDEIYDGSTVVVPDIDPSGTWKVKMYGNERRI